MRDEAHQRFLPALLWWRLSVYVRHIRGDGGTAGLGRVRCKWVGRRGCKEEKAGGKCCVVACREDKGSGTWRKTTTETSGECGSTLVGYQGCTCTSIVSVEVGSGGCTGSDATRWQSRHPNDALISGCTA